MRESHGDGPPKIRLVDDYKISGIHATLDLLETSAPGALNTTLLMSRTHAHSWKQVSLLMVIADCAHAYKRLGVDFSQPFLAHVEILAPTGIPMYASLNTQPFGSAWGPPHTHTPPHPSNWARITDFFEFSPRKLFPLVMHLRRRLLRDRTRGHDTKRSRNPKGVRRVIRIRLIARQTSGASSIRPAHRGGFNAFKRLHTCRISLENHRRYTRRNPADLPLKRFRLPRRRPNSGGRSDLPYLCYFPVTVRRF